MHVFLSVQTHTKEKTYRVGEKGIEAARQCQGDRGMTQQRLLETRNCASPLRFSLFPQQGHVSPQTGAP